MIMDMQPVTVVEVTDDESPLAALAREVCQASTGAGWDQSPMLTVIMNEGEGLFGLVSLPVPDEVWSVAHPTEVILALACSTEPALGKAASNCIGYAFMCEGWMFPGPHNHVCAYNDATCSYVQWLESGRSIADHVDGVEQRSVTIVTLAGEAVFVSQERGSEPKVTELTDRHDEKLSGNVPDALWKLVDATKRALGRQ